MRLIHRLFILSLYLLAGCSSTEERQVSDHFDGKRFFNPTWDGEPFPKLSDVIRLMRAPKKKWPTQLENQIAPKLNEKLHENEVAITFINHK